MIGLAQISRVTLDRTIRDDLDGAYPDVWSRSFGKRRFPREHGVRDLHPWPDHDARLDEAEPGQPLERTDQALW